MLKIFLPSYSKKGVFQNSVLLLLSLLLITSCWSPKKAKKIFESQITEAPFDALIVPGVPYNGDGWDTIMKLRVHWAQYLFEQKKATHIIFSGSAVYSPYYEGKIMRQYAIAMGLPADKLFAEIQAEHSVENVYYSILKGKELGFKTFALATDPYQNYFMKDVFDKRVEYLYFLPFDYDIMSSIEMVDPIIDAEKCKASKFVPITERESKWQRWRGTTGKNVDFDKL